jgi:hypothetical protein
MRGRVREGVSQEQPKPLPAPRQIQQSYQVHVGFYANDLDYAFERHFEAQTACRHCGWYGRYCEQGLRHLLSLIFYRRFRRQQRFLRRTEPEQEFFLATLPALQMVVGCLSRRKLLYHSTVLVRFWPRSQVQPRRACWSIG